LGGYLLVHNKKNLSPMECGRHKKKKKGPDHLTFTVPFFYLGRIQLLNKKQTLLISPFKNVHPNKSHVLLLRSFAPSNDIHKIATYCYFDLFNHQAVREMYGLNNNHPQPQDKNAMNQGRPEL
jgi:hypothetical protein